MTINFKIDSRDWWIGVYHDCDKSTLYICLLPCLVIIIRITPTQSSIRRAARTEVELHPAAMFDCPECGRENFTRMIRPAMDREEVITDLMEKYEIDREEAEAQEGEFLMAPESVTCAFCNLAFPSKDDLDHEAPEVA